MTRKHIFITNSSRIIDALISQVNGKPVVEKNGSPDYIINMKISETISS